jgi:hypothetical protein
MQNSVVSMPATATCEPHGDHWHCPSGVPEPTTPPSATPTGSEEHDDHDHDHETTATACEPHGDHWHCPSGVAEPTSPPEASTLLTGTSTAAPNTTSAAAPSTLPEFQGAGTHLHAGMPVLGLGIGAVFGLVVVFVI